MLQCINEIAVYVMENMQYSHCTIGLVYRMYIIYVPYLLCILFCICRPLTDLRGIVSIFQPSCAASVKETPRRRITVTSS
jgi:hypothetical protein